MPVYVEPGYLLFQRDTTLYAQKFDLKNFKLIGKASVIADNLVLNIWDYSPVSVARNGRLVHRSAEGETGSQFVWFDRDGNQLGYAGQPAAYNAAFDLSPDEKQIAVMRSDSASNKRSSIYVLEWERDIANPITFVPAIHGTIVWHPDGRQVAFSSIRKDNFDIFVKNSDGTGEEIPLVETPENDWMKDWSKDGRYIVYQSKDGELYSMPLLGERQPFLIFESPAGQNQPSFSYDVKWLAYSSNPSGRYEIYVVSFPAAEQRVPISNRGGTQPRWKGDGTELYFLALDGNMMAVDMKNPIKPGSPYKLFNTGLSVDLANNQYEVTEDGERFLLLKPVSELIHTPITAILNWTSLLEK